MTICIQDNCNKNALYNYKYEKGYRYCNTHKSDNMTNKSKKCCDFGDCNISATKDNLGIKKFCTTHHINKIIKEKKIKSTVKQDENKLCIVCTTNPCIFNLKGLKPAYCKDCVPGGNIGPGKDQYRNCINKLCIVCAKTSRTFNLKGLSPAYCKDCIPNGNIGSGEGQYRNCVNKLCSYTDDKGVDCVSIALYGINEREYCSDHKDINMVYIGCKKECNEKGCTVTPSFQNENKKYCAAHRKPGYITLYPVCIHEGCEQRARFNYPEKKGVKFCSKHNKPDMIDKDRGQCIAEGCSFVAEFNYKNEKGYRYCINHRTGDMVSKKYIICKFDGCKTGASYGIGKKKTYCLTHKTKEMYSKYSKPCNKCNNHTMYKRNVCSYCNPELVVPKNETKLLNLLKENNITFFHDKSPGNLNTKYRPDFLIPLDKYNIIIECDENQHNVYTRDYELMRMQEIQKALQKPTLFIRFNPDNHYRNKIKKQTKLSVRFKNLIKIYNEYKDIELKEELKIIYMYFDCSCTTKCNYIH